MRGRMELLEIGARDPMRWGSIFLTITKTPSVTKKGVLVGIGSIERRRIWLTASRPEVETAIARRKGV